MLETRLTKTKFQYGVIYSTQILVPMRLHPHMSLGTGLRSKDSLVASQFGSYIRGKLYSNFSYLPNAPVNCHHIH